MSIHTHIYIYIHIYIYGYTYIHTHIYMYIYIYTWYHNPPTNHQPTEVFNSEAQVRCLVAWLQSGGSPSYHAFIDCGFSMQLSIQKSIKLDDGKSPSMNL